MNAAHHYDVYDGDGRHWGRFRRSSDAQAWVAHQSYPVLFSVRAVAPGSDINDIPPTTRPEPTTPTREVLEQLAIWPLLTGVNEGDGHYWVCHSTTDAELKTVVWCQWCGVHQCEVLNWTDDPRCPAFEAMSYLKQRLASEPAGPKSLGGKVNAFEVLLKSLSPVTAGAIAFALADTFPLPPPVVKKGSSWVPPTRRSEPIASDDAVREGVRFLKREFIGWRDPPVELPAKHVIERVVRALLERDPEKIREP